MALPTEILSISSPEEPTIANIKKPLPQATPTPAVNGNGSSLPAPQASGTAPQSSSAAAAAAVADMMSSLPSSDMDAPSTPQKGLQVLRDVNDEDAVDFEDYDSSGGIDQTDGGTGETEEETDDDEPVKLFVGQVPKSLAEEDLFPTFSEFGPIKELTVIRDKHTGQHRGCAFVTYWSASAAEKVQEVLHDQLTFPNGRKPVQIRPAIGSNSAPATPEQENKLFIGMTSRNADEHAIRELFAPFGEIREIYIIRNADGSNKGCAFLKFSQRGSALSAIDMLNSKVVMDGATRPLIVKFADTKAQRRARGNGMPRMGGPGRGQSGHGANSPYFIPPVPVYTNYQGQRAPPIGMPHQYSQYPQYGQNSSQNFMYVPTGPYGYPSAPFNQMGGNHSGAPGKMYHHRGDGTNGNSRPKEGPPGANLFIYHLPHDLTDADLATAFAPFGNVISAKVYVDKFTGESKGFGFVSYDSVTSADAAIEQMNGFQIGTKRLKVQHKRVGGQSYMGSEERMGVLSHQHDHGNGQGNNGSDEPSHEVLPMHNMPEAQYGMESVNGNMGGLNLSS